MPSRRLTHRFTAFAALAAMACGDVSLEAAVDAADGMSDLDAAAHPLPLMAVGGSDLDGTTFVPLDGCPELPIIHGLQGGYHVWGSVRVRDVAPRKALLRVRLRDVATGALVPPGDVTLSVTLESAAEAGEDGGWLERTGLPIFVADPCPIDGRVLQLEGRVVDLYGVEREADGCLVPRMLPEWRFACARSP